MMYMKSSFLVSAEIIVLLGSVPQVCAQSIGLEKEEVRVEWDHSRRPAIQSAPFSSAPWDDYLSRLPSPQDITELQQKDLVEKTWTVQFNDGTIRRMLQRWSAEAGYQLLWDVPRDYPIEVEVKLHGNFRDVVWLVVKSLSGTDAPVQATINSDVRLVRIVRFLNGQAR
jgi:Toxin co-regulated pilus biosynthesis protein Q